MTDAAEFRPDDELPRRLAGEIELPDPDPNKPLYFETREDVLMRVRDGLERYEGPSGAGAAHRGLPLDAAGGGLLKSQPIRGNDVA